MYSTVPCLTGNREKPRKPSAASVCVPEGIRNGNFPSTNAWHSLIMQEGSYEQMAKEK